MKTRLTIAIALTAVLFSASVQAAPQEELQVARGQAAIINAIVVGAEDYAPTEIKQAREALNQSRRAIARKDHTLAGQLASMAAATARVAEMKAMQLRGLIKTASR